MKEKGKSILRQALIRVLCCALAAVVLGVAVHTAYGHIFKTHAIETALGCALPEDGRLVDYSFFLNRLSATLTFPRGEYEEIKGSLEEWCFFRETSPASVQALEISYMDGKELELAEYLVGSVPPDDFCGILCRTADETVLHVERPSYAISEKWR